MTRPATLHRPRRGFTLIEVLMALAASSVVLVGAGVMFMQMVDDQGRAAYRREHFYSRARGYGEVLWTIRGVARPDLRQGALRNEAWIDDTSIAAPVKRTVVTYERHRIDQQEPPVDDSIVTGILWQWGSVVYRREVGKTQAIGEGLPTSSFNTMSQPQLQAFCQSATEQAKSEVLAIGVETFDVAYVRDPTEPVGSLTEYYVEWNLTLTR